VLLRGIALPSLCDVHGWRLMECCSISSGCLQGVVPGAHVVIMNVVRRVSARQRVYFNDSGRAFVVLDERHGDVPLVCGGGGGGGDDDDGSGDARQAWLPLSLMAAVGASTHRSVSRVLARMTALRWLEASWLCTVCRSPLVPCSPSLDERYSDPVDVLPGAAMACRSGCRVRTFVRGRAPAPFWRFDVKCIVDDGSCEVRCPAATACWCCCC
jgi:hypothetical protein